MLPKLLFTVASLHSGGMYVNISQFGVHPAHLERLAFPASGWYTANCSVGDSLFRARYNSELHGSDQIVLGYGIANDAQSTRS